MKNEPLFNLVKSLSQTEKTYFRKFAKSFSGKETNYLVLFDEMDRQSSYDEALLKKKIGTKYFAQYKKHLNDRLMDSLRAYHASKSIENLISSHIQNFEIFYKKGLLYPAKKALLRARKIARKEQRLLDLLKIRKYEALLVKEEDNIIQIDEHIELYQSTAAAVSNDILQQIELEKIHVSLVKWNKKIEWVRSALELEQLDKIVVGSVIQKHFQNHESESQRLYILGLYNYLKGDLSKSKIYFHTQLSLMNSNSLINSNEFEYYKCAANNALLHLFIEPEKAGVFIDIIKTSKTEGEKTKNYVQLMNVLLQLMDLCISEQFENAQNWIEQNSKFIDQFYESVHLKNIMYNEFTLLSFYEVNAHLGNGNPKKGLKAINKFLNNAHKLLKEDSYALARIINLLIHYELSNTDLLEYELNSTRNYLKNKKRSNILEKRTLTFIQSSLSTSSKKDKTQLLVGYSSDLKMIKSKQFEGIAFKFFDFLAWVDRVKSS